MRREWLLATGVAVATLVIALLCIRWLAPTLLGLPADLALVRVAKSMPAFYEGIFRSEEDDGSEFLLPDPITRVRNRPMFQEWGFIGPHDILGFRNRSVPVSAHVVIVGDSQTYGNNALQSQNWPSYFGRNFGPPFVLYSMATGGWAAPQYLEMEEKVLSFLPNAVIVAFYSGNDPLETFAMAYGNEHWKRLQADSELSAADAPAVTYPPATDGRWAVEFADGVKTVFTPGVRLASVQQGAVVDAGWQGMLIAVREMAALYESQELTFVVTVIPTKEYVYARKVDLEISNVPESYRELADNESRRLSWFQEQVDGVPGAQFVDVAGPLQAVAMGGQALYPDDIDGHPTHRGYAVIGDTLAAAMPVAEFRLLQGLVQVDLLQQRVYALAKGWDLFVFANADVAEKTGWDIGDNVPYLPPRAASRMRLNQIVTVPQPQQFGPRAVQNDGARQADGASGGG